MLFAAAMVHLPTGSVLYSVDNSDPSQLNLGARESQDDSGSIPRVSEQADAAGTSSSRSRASSAAEGRSDASSASVFDGEGSGGLRPSPPASQRLRSGSMDGRLSTSRLQAARRTRRSLKSSRGNAKSRAQLPETTKRVPHISAVVRTVCTMVKMNLCMGSARYVGALCRFRNRVYKAMFCTSDSTTLTRVRRQIAFFANPFRLFCPMLGVS